MLNVIYAECHLCWVSFMLSVMTLSVTYKPFMLGIALVNIVILIVIMLSTVAPLLRSALVL